MSASHDISSEAARDAPQHGGVSQAVRFASVDQQIEPAANLSTSPQEAQHAGKDDIDRIKSPEEAMKELALGLHSSHIQQRRTNNFAFEPCSLPASRVASNESTPNMSSREPTRSEDPSPKATPPASAMTTPPLTPHGTQHGTELKPESQIGAPSPSTRQSGEALDQDTSRPGHSLPSTRSTTAHPSGESGPTPATSQSQDPSTTSQSQKRSNFVLGPSEQSSATSLSRDNSSSQPSSEKEADTASSSPGPSRPFTPGGDRDDPYARSKRAPQPKNIDAIDSRFIFGANDARRRSGINLSTGANAGSVVPRASSGKDIKNEHRKSTLSLFGVGNQHKDRNPHEERQGSMSDLKRFFGLGNHHKAKRNASPATPVRASMAKPAGTKTPPRHESVAHGAPFADDHGLEKKYGKFGKILGSGAGGSVRLLKRSSDGRTFAVKQFRERHSYESERDYNKKVTAEFCIGSTLHHGNIIETLDIVQEGGHWYEVMEYAPYDLFAIVMTGKMSREEVNCCFLQIVNGVSFLHASGLAHRDLKLDNVVVNEFGIMKIIDFGSASVFKYPFENDIILASGVVGSDPYLAPEVYDERKYDPQPTDVWSLAIIFACMSLRRFPWKAPRLTDNSYKLFISEPYTEPEETAHKERAKSTPDVANSTPAAGDTRPEDRDHVHHHRHSHAEKTGDPTHDKAIEAAKHATAPPGNRIDAPKGDVIKGPWRLLRLLPRETRNIISHMLKIDPEKRATLSDVQADPWVKGSPVCQQLEHGKVQRAGTHVHTLEPGSTTPAPSAK